MLAGIETINHSYPHDWRTKKPVIFRATPQWFCSIQQFKEKILRNIDKVDWFPKWGKEKITSMILTRNDWCISRQRAWGVPIIIFYNEDGTPIIEKEVFDHVIDLIKKYGVNIWFEKKPEDLLPKNYKNKHSPNNLFRKEIDTMDVWFDSGISWKVLKSNNLKFPADLYLEGSDQYRGWFNSSLITSVILNETSPFKKCVAHGFVLDKNFDKMSKSTGNAINPLDVINRYGVDVLRLWAATADFKSDVVISDAVLEKIAEMYFKIRNTFRFLLGNISDYHYDEKIISDSELSDKSILLKLEDVKNSVINNFEEFNFVKAISKINYFINNDLSKFYLNFTKDILYCDFKSGTRRKQVQKNISDIIDNLMRLLAPVMPFTMEEVNDFFPFKKETNIMLYNFPKKTNKYVENKDLLIKVKKLDDFIIEVNKKIEEARSIKIINTSQEADIFLKLPDEFCFIKKDISSDELARILIVSNVIYDDGISENIVVKHSSGIKCPRCWNYTDEKNVKKIDDSKVCERCFNVLNYHG